MSSDLILNAFEQLGAGAAGERYLVCHHASREATLRGRAAREVNAIGERLLERVAARVREDLRCARGGHLRHVRFPIDPERRALAAPPLVRLERQRDGKSRHCWIVVIDRRFDYQHPQPRFALLSDAGGPSSLLPITQDGNLSRMINVLNATLRRKQAQGFNCPDVEWDLPEIVQLRPEFVVGELEHLARRLLGD